MNQYGRLEQERRVVQEWHGRLHNSQDDGDGWGAGLFILVCCGIWLAGIAGSLYVAVRFVKWAWE